MSPRLTLLVARFQGTLPVYHLAPALGLPATAKSLASFLLPIAIAIVLYHTFLSSSLIHRVAPHARRIRHHATPIAPYARQSSRAYQTRCQFSTSFRPILHGGCGRHSVAGSDSARQKSAPQSSFAPAGLWDVMGYRYPPLKRWAIVDRPCGADGPTQEDWGAVQARGAIENSPAIYRWGTWAKDRSQSREGRKRRGPRCTPPLYSDRIPTGVYDKTVRVAAVSVACGACRWCSAVWKPSYRGSLFGRPIHWTNGWVGGRNVRIIA